MMPTIEKNISLAPYTTFKVGGEAEYFTTVTTEEELLQAVLFAQKEGHRIQMIGGGSNLLVSDDGVKGLVIRNALKGKSHSIENDTVMLTVSAGEELDAIVAYTVEHGWWGMENLSHIPGSIGATPIQNVGAYGVEAKDVIASVRVLDTEKNIFVTLEASACAFGYRDSIFKTAEGKKFIVTAVTYRLSLIADPHVSYRDLHAVFADRVPTQQAIREAVIKIRAGKFPNWHEVGTAGSFFKNPIITQAQYKALQLTYPALPAFPAGEDRMKVSLGWILDKALGLRGYTQGRVSAYENQALVVVAREGACASDIQNFAQEITERIKSEIGIDVEWEVSLMK